MYSLYIESYVKGILSWVQSSLSFLKSFHNFNSDEVHILYLIVLMTWLCLYV